MSFAFRAAPLALFAGLCLSLPSHALDATTAIKVTPLLKTTSSWDGRQIVYPEGQGQVTSLIVEIVADGETGWHEHPVPSFAYILEGDLEVTTKDGGVKVLKPGDALAEVVNTFHNGRALHGKPVKLVVFYAGVVGKALTIAHPEFKLPEKAQ